MNRTMRSLFSLVLTLILVLALATPAFAATASITYNGQKEIGRASCRERV